MRTLITSCLLAMSAVLSAQLTTTNPPTFPLHVSDIAILSNGKALAVSEEESFITVIDDIEQAGQGAAIKYIYLKGKRFGEIKAFNDGHIVAFNDAHTPYFSTDSAKTWERVKGVNTLNDFFLFQDWNLWLHQKGTDELHYSFNQGQSWGMVDTLSAFQLHTGAGIDKIVLKSDTSGWLYMLSSSGLQGLFNADSVFAGDTIRTVVPLASDLLVYLSNGKAYRVNPSGTQKNLQFTLSGTFLTRVVKKDNTLALVDTAGFAISYNNGLTWSSGSLNPPSYTVLYHRGDIYGSKLYISDTYLGTGVWYTLDFTNGVHSSNLSHNFSYSRGVCPLYNGRFFYPTQSRTNDSTTYALLVGEDAEISTLISYSGLWSPMVSFADSANGLALGTSIVSGNRLLLQTSDGGQNWTSQNLNNLAPFANLTSQSLWPNMSRDGQNMFMNFNKTLYTMDRSFSITASSPLPGNNPGRLYFKSADTGIVIGSSTIHYTSDGGSSFNKVLQSPRGIFDFQVLSNGYAATSSYDVYFSPDLQGPWQRKNNISAGGFSSIVLATEGLKLFVQDPQTHYLYYSADTGKTFQSAQVPMSALYDAYRTNDTTYVLFGKGGAIHRLIIVDDSLNIAIDTTTSGNVGVEETSSVIHFFPNPAVAEVNLKFPDSRKRSLQLLGADGKTVLQREIRSENYRLDISGLKSGMYFLKVETNGTVKTLRLLKME